jgi:hypothetical protein
MKLIKTSTIAPGSAMPLKGGMLAMLQDNSKETTTRMVNGQDLSSLSRITALFGRWTESGGTYAITAGALLYNGEIYRWPSVNVTPGVGQVVVGTITEFSQSGTGLDPVEFSDASLQNVNVERRIVWSAGASGSGDFNLSAVKFINGTFPQVYNAGNMYALTGTWTLPGGAADFSVNISTQGAFIHIDFEIVNGTLSNNTTYFRLALASLLNGTPIVPKRNAHGVAYMTNSNNSPANELARVEIPAGTNDLIFYRVAGTSHQAVTGGLDVKGSIMFENDYGF